MIEFMAMNREIILNNHMERVKLKRDINNDMLTNVGVARYSDEKTGEELLHKDDKALYEAKKNSRNGIVVYE